MKMVVFDDESSARRQWQDRLGHLNQGQVKRMDSDCFREQIQELERRREIARERDGVDHLADLKIESEFDEIDLLLVDYDLFPTLKLTGEEVAYLLRCFSTCGLIVALNQFGTKRFDLSLQGHPESFADLNIGDPYLDDPGLWGPDGWREFRPWHWPLLQDLLEGHRKRVDDAREWMSRPILECLALDEASVGILPRRTEEFIQVPGSSQRSPTVDEFVMRSGKGLKRRDSEGAIKDLKPRIAAARLHRWLESFVLAGQEVLVDAPHLVTRFPSLLQGDAADVESWSSTADLQGVAGLDGKLLERALYPRSHWLSRPAWYWSKLREHEAIREVRDPWSVESHDFVFCEDTSRFSPSADSKSFVADLPSAFTRRYVRGIDSIEYHPGVRFSL